MSDVITLMGLNFKFAYVSPSIKRLTGFSVEEASQFLVEHILSPDSFQEILNIVEEEIRAETNGSIDPDRSRLIGEDTDLVWQPSACVWPAIIILIAVHRPDKLDTRKMVRRVLDGADELVEIA